ncbi:hypothetical protein [Massilia sp. 9I]|uniref:hypothetical protein n=1 Tax=Massilia sp. 9I TaxID=2653152 RepID=UPI0012F00CC3|nr:hypothetical protein [Massilia sp. 9I]VXB63174.1 conserved exported hypothetical protein [Massilia sp. 9I]
MKSLIYLAAVLVVLSGCSQTPIAKISYYPAKSSLSARLVRTLGCDKNNLPIVATTPTVTTTFSADTSKLLSLDLKELDGTIANSDIKLEFYADRRLKSVNATTTGQGEPIIKSAVSLLAAAALEQSYDASVVEKCQEFKKHFGEQTLTLIYIAEQPFDNFDDVRFAADTQSARYANQFKKLVGDACFRVKAATASAPVTAGSGGRVAMLGARQPAMVPAAVSIGPVGACEVSTIWSGYVPVGQKGADYMIPIPSAAVFGKQVFAAAFDEAGALTSVQYGKESGAGAAINAAQSTFDALHTTDTEKTAQLKAEADVIAAQQRLVKCKTTPMSC